MMKLLRNACMYAVGWCGRQGFKWFLFHLTIKALDQLLSYAFMALWMGHNLMSHQLCPNPTLRHFFIFYDNYIQNFKFC